MLTKQTAQPPDDFAGALIVFTNVGEDIPHLVQRRRVSREEHLGRLGVTENRPERLVEFVGHRRSQFACGGDACYMSELFTIALKLGLHPFPLGDVADGGQYKDAFGRANRIKSNLYQKLRAILASSEQVPTSPHSSSLRRGKERGSMSGMTGAKPLRHKDLDRLAN